ncbi:ATP-binding protein [Zoogloeaceae bacterium G21618-S1]|nr:ATP-binding protein [Zoogloeaceae bacterium G21618-S1]
MNPRNNPYAPGAGTPPPELAGRDEILERASVALHRTAHGMAARSMILYGLRGVGKTVLLRKISEQAEEAGWLPVFMEAPESRSLPALLAPALRAAIIRLDRLAAAKKVMSSAWGAFASFVSSIKVRYDDVQINLDIEPELGVADSGDLEMDLTDLFTALGTASAERNTAIVLAIDELQYVPERELSALITALHTINQKQLPITLIAAGLPQLLGQMGQAKSYAERLFEFVPIDRLPDDEATRALCVPAQAQGVEYTKPAVHEVLEQTQGYPYFLQEWGKQAWAVADSSPIDDDDARTATELALAELDASFFRVRFDRLTPAEKRYVRAMAELGPGAHRSGEIAKVLDKPINSVAPTRAALIKKGMVFSPAHGDTAFTVPLFDGYIMRTMPDLTQ